MRFLQFLMSAVLGWGSAALAQGEQTITFGQTVEGVLSSETGTVEYTFAGEQGQFVRITMLQVDSMDPYLRLLDADGNVLAEDDDSAGSLNSRIGPYRRSEEHTSELQSRENLVCRLLLEKKKNKKKRKYSTDRNHVQVR